MKRIFLILFLITLVVISSVSGEDCLIKGNINSKGEKIYHVPGDSGYDATKINTEKGERWFCSEAEAVAAGWRAVGEMTQTRTPNPTKTIKPTKTPSPTKTPKPTATLKPTETALPYEVIGDHVYRLKSHYGELTPNQARFLASFNGGRVVDQYFWAEDYYPLGMSATDFAHQLIEDGYLRNPTKAELIERVYQTKTAVAEELRQRGLPVSGLKEELIDRLIEADPEITDQYSWQYDLYYPSNTGRRLLEEYFSDYDKAQENACMDVLECLINGDFPEAVRISREYNSWSGRRELMILRSESDMLEGLRQIYSEPDYWTICGLGPEKTRHSVALFYLFDTSMDWVVRGVDPQAANELLIVH